MIEASMSPIEVSYFRVDDWYGLYFGDDLVREGHSLDAYDVLEYMTDGNDYILVRDEPADDWLDYAVEQSGNRMPGTVTEMLALRQTFEYEEQLREAGLR